MFAPIKNNAFLIPKILHSSIKGLNFLLRDFNMSTFLSNATDNWHDTDSLEYLTEAAAGSENDPVLQSILDQMEGDASVGGRKLAQVRPACHIYRQTEWVVNLIHSSKQLLYQI